ncbi:TauD/TfdA dioxygenase family protein [Candidatus Entotheonella palauensis]|uniref:TauD/TfdA dioxygenase family protein n=1 Tax=Candidatus Entotheonella palauensis TaxID=93172 RepID=UPI000B7EDA65|nr:TauD/TfdA family dioxygenase [Candidatus Entotheonella palauensis]
MAASAAAIDVRPLSVHIGAEIHGVDLTRPLAPEEVQGIRAALLQWKVVFFREQFLDHQMQIDFARQFGDLTPGHVVFGNDDTYPEIYSVAKHRKANRYRGQALQRPWTGWHADITAAINPPAASILRGDIVPPYGGDTQWTNLVAAYHALSPTMQGIVDELRGEHRFNAPQGVQASNNYNDMVGNRLMVSQHPLVRVHPETGEKALYVSPSFLKSIVGMTPRESQAMLELLWEHSVRTEFTVRFKWEPGSMAFWDNRSVVHLAPSDIFETDFDRQFYRVTLMGDVPVGVDGSPSTAIEGNPIEAVPAS